MYKKRIVTVITTIILIISLCAAALLLSSADYTTTSTGDYSYVYDKVLGVSLPVYDDWSTVSQGIEESDSDYADYQYASYDESIENLKNTNTYFSTTNLDNFEFCYYGTGIAQMTDEEYFALSDQELQDIQDKIVQNYISELQATLNSTEYCTVNGVDWFHASLNSCEGYIDDNIYVGKLNGHAIVLYFTCLKEVNSKYSVTDFLEHITTDKITSVNSDTDKSIFDKIQEYTQLKNIPLWSFGVILLIIVLVGIKIAKPGQFFDDCLSLKVAKGLQGIAALGIVMHHLVQHLGQNELTGIAFFENIGVLCVGIFFFFSGYGLLLSYNTKDNYLEKFFSKRLPVLLLPFFLSSWIYIIIRIMTGENFSTVSLLEHASTILLPNANAWYAVEIFILYLVFYLCYRFIKNKNLAYALNGIFCIVIVICSLLLGHCSSGEKWFMGEWWYNSTFLFFIGMTYARFRHKLLPYIKKLYWLLLPLFSASFAFLYYLTVKRLDAGGYWTETETSKAYLDKIATLGVQLPMVMCFIVALLLFTMKVKIGNKFTRFIGTFTLELYLVQNIFIGYIKDFGLLENSALYVLSAFAFSIFTGYALHKLCTSLTSMFIAKTSSPSVPPAERNRLIDILRFIMCFLVVCVHIPFPGEAGNIIIAYGKIAVPFFIVICGFLCYRPDSELFGARLAKQGARLLCITVWANLFYALIYYIQYGSEEFTNQITDINLYNFLMFNQSPYATHLWFLGSIVFSIGIMILLNKLKISNKIIYIFPLLLGIYFFNWRKDGDMDRMIQYRNSIACTLSYFMAGCVLRKHQNWIKEHIRPVVIIFSVSILFACVAIEYSLCKTTAIPYYSAELLTFAVVLLCIVCIIRHTGNKRSLISIQSLGRNCSLNIYIFQIAVIYALGKILGNNSYLLTRTGPITVFIVSLLLAQIIYAIRNLFFSSKH